MTTPKPTTPPPTKEELATAQALERLCRLIAEAKAAIPAKTKAA